MRLALLSLLAVGCWKDLPADGSLRCAPGAQPCPGGYHCAGDNRCWHDGHEPDLREAPPDDLGETLPDLSHPGDAGPGCATDNECSSGFCTDGVCCDKRCLGQCQACSSGACKTAPLGPPPPGRPACTGSGTACGGYCDGLGGVACVHPIGNVSCGAGCNGICDGKGNCSAAGSCANGYACGGGACLTSCAGNADCQSGYLCKNSTCIITTEIDCLDGIDNNGDGLADCQDPSCGAIVHCVDDPGSELGLELPSGTCPSGYPSPSPLFQGLMFQPFCQGCSCSSMLSCAYTPMFAIGSGCTLGIAGAAPLITLSSTSGSASTACTAIPSPLPSPSPLAGSVNPGTPVASSPKCTVSGSTTTPSPTWQVSSKWCGGARTSATCPAGKKCVARPSAGQALCTRIPNGSTCPAGYQMTQQTWFADFTDNRTCTSCGCTDTGAATNCGTGSNDQLQVFSDPGCGGVPAITVSGGSTCSDMPAVNHYVIFKPTAGMTFPVCSMPAGSGTAAPADPSLLCCASCACTSPPCLGGCPSGNFCDGSACTGCNTATFCGASCSPCAPLADTCSGGVCKCGSASACNPTNADNCTAGVCRCGSNLACSGGFFGCLGGMCL